MRLRKRFYCIFLLLLLALEPVFAGKTLYGTELCSSVYNFLKKNGFSPATQSLVTSGENAFPYNVIVTFPSNNGNEAENLIFIIPQEDVSENQNVLKETLSALYNSRTERTFNIIVLFAYGEKQKIEKPDMIFGTQVFIENLNSNHNYTAVILDLNNTKNTIEFCSQGIIAPSWLIQNTYSSCQASGNKIDIPRFFVSHIASYSFIHNRILSIFYENEIPAIFLKLAPPANQNIKQIILDSTKRFASINNKNWERHFMMVRLFGHLYMLTEQIILRIVLPVIMLWILFIFILVFINSRLKRRAWSAIRKIWFTVPVIYAALVVSFILGRFVFINMGTSLSDTARVYGILAVQILTALFLLSLFFILILSLNFSFEERSIDYLLVICCFINQSVFILIDISLSPIFVTICLLSFIALTIRNNALHVIIFILMILPLIPYGNAVLFSSNIRQLSAFIESNRNISFIIPLVIYPIYLILFRTLISIRSHSKKMHTVIMGAVSYFIFVSVFLIILGSVRTKQVNSKQPSAPVVQVSLEDSDLIQISYSDKKIFDDLIRTLNIELKKDCILCDVQVTAQTQTPVLYTDNDYKMISENSIRFSIPDYPPKKMTFSYGTTTEPCKIIVSAVIEDESDESIQGNDIKKEGIEDKGTNSYKFISQNYTIGDIE